MDYVIALFPPIATLALFFLVVRALVRADRSERQAESEFLAEHRGENVAPPAARPSDVTGDTDPAFRQKNTDAPSE